MATTPTPDRQARHLIEATRDAIGRIPDPTDLLGLRSPNPTPATTTPLPGTLPHGLDKITDDWETGQIRTSRGVTELAYEVADEWADKLGYAAPALADTFTWLADTTEHAYNRLDTDTWDTSISTLTTAWRIATRLAGDDPDPTGWSCPLDGAMTVRYPQDDGFTDIIFCTDCGTPWSAGSLIDATSRTISEQARPDLMISPKDAPLFGTPAKTVYTWIRRGKITAQQTRTGYLIRLGDLCELQ